MADFTKDGAQVDEWAQIAVASIRVGADVAIPEDIGILLEITICQDTENAHANGALITVEVSSNITGDEDWAELPSGVYRTSGGTAERQQVDQSSTSTTLYVAYTTNMETKNDRYFVKNNTIANSEVVRNNGFGNDDYITLVDALANTQTVDPITYVYSIVDQNVVRVPKEFRRARVLVWNDDADCTVCTRTRKALATDIV